MLKNASGVTTYPVTVIGEMWPAYNLTLSSGFIAYMGTKDERPETVDVTGAQYTYDNNSGRLIISKVTGSEVRIEVPGWMDINTVDAEQQAVKVIRNGQLLILRGGKAYTITGTCVE